MKTDTILVGMTMAILLLSLPAAASDYTLDVFGNANEDDTINMQDVTYTELIILEYRDQTELADGKYDGKINMQDVTQIELIILGRELELTIKDMISYYSSLSGQVTERIVTIEKPVNRVIVTYYDPPQVLRALGVADRIVGVGDGIKQPTLLPLFPEISKLPGIGRSSSPDFEKILSLQPDIIIPGMGGSWKEANIEKTPGVAVVYLSLTNAPDYVQSIRKFGYVFDRREEAEELLQWREDGLNEIKDETDGLTDDEKPRVLVLCLYRPGGDYRTWAEDCLCTIMCDVAGGRSILPEDSTTGVTVDPEWVVEQNPDVIFAYVSGIEAGYGVDDPSALAACREELMGRPELAGVTAVKDEMVYVFGGGLSLSGTGMLITAQYMAKCFHPDLFADLDPKECHQEYLTEFQGLDYDLNEHGVFIYPPLEES